ncbi:hypothetical protein [Plectonema phage Pbo-yong3]|uniref:hypothetical protein n=1 Tax=Plectonema phage Pbo-yong3 TaxID=2970324 RepID=UPI00403CFF9E|nr:hypothetical protein [Plectonema phage Pbo-yong3]
MTPEQLFDLAYTDKQAADAYIETLPTVEEAIAAIQVLSNVSTVTALGYVANGYGVDSDMMHKCVAAVTLDKFGRQMLYKYTGYSSNNEVHPNAH